MKRIRIVGLCLVAVFALSAIVASAASAETAPTYKVCAKVKETGKFNDKNCSVASKGGKKEGDYELAEWSSAKKKAFTGKNGVSTLLSYIPEKESEFWTGGTVAGTVVCKNAKSVGELTGPKTATTTVTFASCTSEGKKCTSAGAPKAGDIVTKKLSTVLGFDEGGQVVTLVEGGGEGVNNQAEFNCEGLAVETNGSLLGVDTGNLNKIEKSYTTTFAVNAKSGQEVVFAGVPNESELVWGPGTGAIHVLKTHATPPGVSIPSGEKTTSVNKGEALEIET